MNFDWTFCFFEIKTKMTIFLTIRINPPKINGFNFVINKREQCVCVAVGVMKALRLRAEKKKKND